MKKPHCRSCGHDLEVTFANLGSTPLANSFLSLEQLDAMEPHYPLHARVCSNCLLVQLEEVRSAESIFSDYLYMSSYSETWLTHCESYACWIKEHLRLDAGSKVVEVASNDGYLLQFFKRQGIKVLGVEPAKNVAEIAIAKGIPTEIAFFGRQAAERLRAEHQADLIVANNVLAHVPDINDFVVGLTMMLKPAGTVTVEFPHLLNLIQYGQFDTIYHEHFSYLSLLAVDDLFSRHGLAIYDVQELPTHGGSLRIFARHVKNAPGPQPGLLALRDKEQRAGLDRIETYQDFHGTIGKVKCDLLDFLITQHRRGKSVAAYGAAAKGNTLLNYCGVGPDFVQYVVDRNPHKQNRFLPGSRLPVLAPEAIAIRKPDFVLILPWNLRDELEQQLKEIRDWGGQFVVPIPELEIF